MKVNHRAFSGGYRFGKFEGQPSGSIHRFSPKDIVSGMTIEPTEHSNAADVLNYLRRTTFGGPETAQVPKEGMIVPTDVRRIVINAVEVEPYHYDHVKVLKEKNLIRFADGLKAIRESYQNVEMILVASEEEKELIKLMSSVADNLGWLEIYSVSSKYPANLQENLYQMIYDEKYPVGYEPAHLGCLFLSMTDVFTIEKVIASHETADSVTIGLAGTGWKEKAMIEVAVGTTMQALKERFAIAEEIRLIQNSVMTGKTLNDDDTVDFDTKMIIALPEGRKRKWFFFLRAGAKVNSFGNTFLSRVIPPANYEADTNLHGEKRACVSCTYCQSVCPVGLIPHLLHKHASKGIITKKLADYRIYDCLECGLCNYVCPSKIEILEDIKKGKRDLEKNEISHNTYIIPFCDMINRNKGVKANG